MITSSTTRKSITTLAITAALLVGVAVEESFRSTPYDDGVGVLTDGFGNTRNVRKDKKVTVERALIQLNENLESHAKEIAQCIDVPLYQYEWEAYISFSYNVGSHAFCTSTLNKKLNRQDYAGACRELLRWNKAGGRVLKGLVERRKREYKQCMGEK